jgi:cellulose synthase/poly-beta-1,6-N-acetylglucosamine synthase-like glycosyltransferase
MEILKAFADLVLLLLAVPALISAGYLLFLTLLSGKLPVLHSKHRQLRFDVIVPAHNESEVIARTMASLKRIDWPADRFRILVCADNCTDSTAQKAREAGATVLERTDSLLRGKGYALDYTFAASLSEGFADAVVVVDADTEVSTNLLDAIAARLENGAQATQVHYGVLNPMASWRTRLFTIATGAVHILRSRARDRLNVSCGVRGTGWCVTHEVLRRVPYRAYSLTEDVEYGIDLGLAGIIVAYVDEADANPEMVSGEQGARTQRQRWERGRFQLIRAKTNPLLAAAWQRRSLPCLDLALDLLVPPISYVGLNIIALLILGAAATYWLEVSRIWLWFAEGSALAVIVYVLRGWQLSKVGWRGAVDLACAPIFLIWKLRLLLSRGRSNEWTRTQRERP